MARGKKALSEPIRICDEHGNATPEFLVSADALLRASAGCPTGKISFPSPQAAMRQAPSTHRRARGNKQGKTKVYQCPFCKQWHLTRQDQNARGAKR